MNNEISKYLYDIKSSIDSIEDFLGNERNFDKYKSNRMLKRAIEREYEIIGEALNRITKIDPDIAISDIRKIISLRNRVIHGYDIVDDTIIWGIIVKYMPRLKKEISDLLKSE